jgi:copper chaperone CopZ
MNTLTFKIPAISCNHCLHTIKTEVGELAGVKSIEGSVTTQVVTIGYDDRDASIEARWRRLITGRSKGRKQSEGKENFESARVLR